MRWPAVPVKTCIYKWKPTQEEIHPSRCRASRLDQVSLIDLSLVERAAKLGKEQSLSLANTIEHSIRD